MANQSILNAFERFWQHTVNALGTKADKSEVPTQVSQLENDENYIKYDAVINFEVPYEAYPQYLSVGDFSYNYDDIERIYNKLYDDEPVKVLLKGIYYFSTGAAMPAVIEPTNVYIVKSTSQTEKTLFIEFVVPVGSSEEHANMRLLFWHVDGNSNTRMSLQQVRTDYQYIPSLDITFEVDGNLNNLSTSNVSYIEWDVISMWNHLLENDNYMDSSKYNINIHGITDFGSGGIYKNKLNITHLQVNEYSFMVAFTYINNNDGSTGSGHIYFSRLSSNMNSISNVNVEMLTLEYRI